MMQKKICREKMEADAYISESQESASETVQNNLDSPLATQHTNEMGENSDIEMDFEVPGINEEEILHSGSPIPVAVAAQLQPEPSSPNPSHRASVEDDEDNGDEASRWIEEFPHPAGVPIEEGVSSFEEWRRDQVKKNELPWSPFESREEWELVQWLMTSGISQKKIDAFLKLKTVRISQNIMSNLLIIGVQI
jgi:hypothetical protein